MPRLEKTFANLERPALVTFITAGDPNADTSLSLLKSLPDSGADIIEIGLPFSDPMADGAIIQAASQRALKGGITTKDILAMIQNFRATDNRTPLVAMGYANTVYAYGLETFAADFGAAGLDGLIVVDLPPEESRDLENELQKQNIDLIRLITPTTDVERLQTIQKTAGGFLYYVSVTGVTGGASADLDTVSQHIDTLKKHCELPIVVGFGIKTPGDAAAMGRLADGVVVGSAIVQTLHEKGRDEAARFVTDLADALLGPIET